MGIKLISSLRYNLFTLIWLYISNHLFPHMFHVQFLTLMMGGGVFITPTNLHQILWVCMFGVFTQIPNFVSTLEHLVASELLNPTEGNYPNHKNPVLKWSKNTTNCGSATNLWCAFISDIVLLFQTNSFLLSTWQQLQHNFPVSSSSDSDTHKVA